MSKYDRPINDRIFTSTEQVRKGTDYGLPYDTIVIPLPNGGEITVIPQGRNNTGHWEAIVWDEDDNVLVNMSWLTTQEVINLYQGYANA